MVLFLMNFVRTGKYLFQYIVAGKRREMQREQEELRKFSRCSLIKESKSQEKRSLR